MLALPNSTDNNEGMPTNKLIPVTSLAMVLELGIFENSSRSKASPRRGARTSTDRTKATPTGMCWFCTSLVNAYAEM